MIRWEWRRSEWEQLTLQYIIPWWRTSQTESLYSRLYRQRDYVASILWQPLTKIVNSTLSSLIEQEFHENYKRTWQEVSVYCFSVY